MSARTPTLVLAFVALVGTVVGLTDAAVAATPATRALDPGPRVVGIEHRTTGIVRRVASISGDIRTEEGPKSVEVTLAADVLFDFDRAELNPAAAARIAEVARQLRSARGPVAIVGYTDAKGADQYNADLSRQRATAVRDALAGEVPAASFTVEGKGAADPVAPDTNDDGSDNPDGRALNRRVTITYARST